MKDTTSKLLIGILATLAAIFFAQAHLHTPAFAQPGGDADPLVTRRYVDDRVAQLSDELAALRLLVVQLADALEGVPPTDAAILPPPPDTITPPTLPPPIPVPPPLPMPAPIPVPAVVPFEVIMLPENTSMILDGGAELVLRAGRATAISGEHGLVDVTAGRDVTNGQTVSHNHLLLVPQTDGRGIFAHNNAWVMVKGGFRIVR